MSQGEQKDSITDLRKWNLVAGGNNPINDVIPASLGYGLENALEFAMTEIGRLQLKTARLSASGDILYALLDPPSICMRTTEYDNALQGWDDEKGRP